MSQNVPRCHQMSAYIQKCCPQFSLNVINFHQITQHVTTSSNSPQLVLKWQTTSHLIKYHTTQNVIQLSVSVLDVFHVVVVIVCHQMLLNYIKCHQMSPTVIKCHHKSPNVIKCHQMLLKYITTHHVTPNVIKCHSMSPHDIKWYQITPNVLKLYH